MSQAPHESINVPSADIGTDTLLSLSPLFLPAPPIEIGNDQYPPQSTQKLAPHGTSDVVDGSGPIFSMYMEMATEEDKKMVENWKADADGILIFVSLSSNLMHHTDSMVIDWFILRCCCVVDLSVHPGHSTEPAGHLQFLPCKHLSGYCRPKSIQRFEFPPCFPTAVHSTKLCSLGERSLVLESGDQPYLCSSCDLVAAMARRYLRVTQSRYSPHKRARIRSFFAKGVESCLLPWAVETLPTLLHISLFLFFAGLVVFLSNVNITILKLVLSWVGVCTALYGCITLMPILRHDSPYYTPLSFPMWPIITGIQFVTFRVLWWFTGFSCFSLAIHLRFRYLTDSRRKYLMLGSQKTAEETALKSSPEIDTRAFMWTFDCLDEDHELERFFSGLPGLRSSKVVRDPLPGLTKERQWELGQALAGLLDRTISSDLLPATVKKRRTMICAKAIDPAHIPDAFSVLNRILFECQYSGPLATEIVQIARSWKTNTDKDTILRTQATISMIVARVRPHDDSWFILASDALGISEAVLRAYAAHGNNLSLAILIHVVRQQFSHFWESSWPNFLGVLEAASNLDVRDTSPELQHNFCALWNQIVLKVQNDNDAQLAYFVLGQIRNTYITLHHDTKSAPTRFSPSTGDEDVILWRPSSYPLCNILGHHPDSTTHIQGVSTSAIFTRTFQHDRDNTVLIDMTSASARAPLRVHESLTDTPLLDNNIYVSVPTATEIRHIPSSPPNLVTTDAIHGSNNTFSRPMHQSIPEPSTSTTPSKSKISASPPDAIAIENTAATHTVSYDVGGPSAPAPSPAFADMLPPGLLLPSDSAVTGSDHGSFLPESRSPALAPVARGPSFPWLSSAPDLGAAAEGEESTNPTLHEEKEKDTPYFSSAIHEDIMVTPDVPSQSLSP